MAMYPEDEEDARLESPSPTQPPAPKVGAPLPPANAAVDTAIAKPPAPLPADEPFARFQKAQPAPKPEPVAPPEEPAAKLPARPKDVDPFDTTTTRTPEQNAEANNFLREQGALGDPTATGRLAGAYDRADARDARQAETDAAKVEREAEAARKKDATTAVRQMKEAGVETRIADDGTTVPVTDEKTGRPVYKPDFVGGPRFDDTTKSWVKDWRNADGSTSPVDMHENGQIQTDRQTGEMYFTEKGKRTVVGKDEPFLRRKAIGTELATIDRATTEKRLAIDDLELNKIAPVKDAYTKGKKDFETAEQRAAGLEKIAAANPAWAQNKVNAETLAKVRAERDRLKTEFAPVREQFEGAKANVDGLRKGILEQQQRQLALYRERDTILAAKQRPQFAAPAAAQANETPDQTAERQRHGIGGTEWQVPDLKAEADKLNDVLKLHAEKVKAAGGNTPTLANLGELDATTLGKVAEARAAGQADVDRQTARVSALKRFDTVSANLEKEAQSTEAQRAQIVTNVRAQQKVILKAIRAGQANATQYDALTESATKALAGLDKKMGNIRARQTDERKALKAGLDGQQGADYPDSLIVRDGPRASVDPEAVALRAAGRSAFLHQDERQSRLDVLEEAKRGGKITHVGDQTLDEAIRTTQAEQKVTLDDILAPAEAQNLRRGLFGLTDGTLGTELGSKYSLGVQQGTAADGTKFGATKLDYAGSSLPTENFQDGTTMAKPIATPVDAAKDFFTNLLVNRAVRSEFPKGPQGPKGWENFTTEQKRDYVTKQGEEAQSARDEAERDKRSWGEKLASIGSAFAEGLSSIATGSIDAGVAATRLKAGVPRALATLISTGDFARAKDALFSARPADAEWANEFSGMVQSYWHEGVDERDREGIAANLAEGIGSAVGFTAAGGVVGKVAQGLGAGAKAIQSAQTATAAAVGAAQNGGSSYREALERGDTDAEAFARFAVGAGLGSTEAVGLGNIMARLDKFTGGSLKKFLLETAKEGLEEGAQEALQQGGMELFDALNGSKNGIDLRTLEGWQKLGGKTLEAAQVAAVTGLIYSAGMGGIVKIDERSRRNRAQRAFETLDAKHAELSAAARSPEGLEAFNAKQVADGRKPITMATAIDLARQVATARAAKATGMLLDDDERSHGIATALDSTVDAAKLTAEIRNRSELAPTLIEIGRQAGPALLTPEARAAIEAEQGAKDFASPEGTAQRRLIAGRLVVDTHLRGALEGKPVPAAIGQALEDMGLLVRRPLPNLPDDTAASEWVVSAPGLELMPGSVRAAVQKAPDNFAFSPADTAAPNRVGADLEQAGDALLSGAFRRQPPAPSPAPSRPPRTVTADSTPANVESSPANVETPAAEAPITAAPVETPKAASSKTAPKLNSKSGRTTPLPLVTGKISEASDSEKAGVQAGTSVRVLENGNVGNIGAIVDAGNHPALSDEHLQGGLRQLLVNKAKGAPENRATVEKHIAAVVKELESRKGDAPATVDDKAAEAHPNPTEGQKEAGNYKMGHVRVAGMDISIENPAGSERSGVSKSGKPWSVTMKSHYGYIRGTEGKDGDHVDVFIKPGTPEDWTGNVFVIDQVNPDGKFDEHKAVIGAATEAEARAAYLANYSKGWDGLGAITAMPVEDFKTWAKSAEAKKPLGLRSTTAEDVRESRTTEPTHRVTMEMAPDEGGFTRRRVIEVTATDDESAAKEARRQTGKAGDDFTITKISEIKSKKSDSAPYKKGDGLDAPDTSGPVADPGILDRGGETRGSAAPPAGTVGGAVRTEGSQGNAGREGGPAGAGRESGSTALPGADDSQPADGSDRRIGDAVSGLEQAVGELNRRLGLTGEQAVVVSTGPTGRVPHVHYDDAGRLELRIDPAHLTDIHRRMLTAAPDHADRWLVGMAGEELAHVADILASREAWEAAGRKGGALAYLQARNRELIVDMRGIIGRAMAKGDVKRANDIGLAILSAYANYFQGNAGLIYRDARDRGEAALKARQFLDDLTAGKVTTADDAGNEVPVHDWAFVSELVRQLVQIERTGTTTEIGVRAFVSKIAKRVKELLDRLKGLAQTPELRAITQRIHEILDLAEGRVVTVPPGPDPEGGLPVLRGKAAEAFALPAEQLRDFIRGEHVDQPKGARRLPDADLLDLSRHFDRMGDTRRGGILTNELARRAADEQAAATREGQRAQSYELLDAIAKLGGLPVTDAMQGELAQLRELPRSKRPGLFRKDGTALDRLASDLRDYGFTFDGPDDLLRALTERLNPDGAEQYGDRIGSMDLQARTPGAEINRLLAKQRGEGLNRAESARLRDLEAAAGQGSLFGDDAMRAPAEDLVLERQTERAKPGPRMEQASLFAAAPAFYSRLEEVIEAKMPNSASEQQALAIIDPAKGSGVKEDEIKWTGTREAIADIAASNGGKVPKAALLSHLKDDGAVRFEEVSTAGQGMPAGYRFESDPRYASGIGDVFAPNGQNIGDATGEYEAGIIARRHAGVEFKPKYGQYQLPGGTNYREMVLAMPPAHRMDRQFRAAMESKYGESYYQEMTPEERAKYARLERDASDRMRARPAYTSSHYQEAGDYVAHMRLNDREDATGAAGTLIEELQSDRHQEGRTKGYLDPEKSAEMRRLGVIERELSDQMMALRKRLLEEAVDIRESEEYQKLLGRSLQNSRDILALNQSGGATGVSDAPFRKDWPVQMFKRALRDAVEQGKEWIGWTTGETQSGRYDLSKHLDSLMWIRDEPEEGVSGGSSKGNLKGMKDGKIVVSEVVTPDALPDMIGKDAAEKLLAAPVESKNSRGASVRRISGLDLKVGGEGMKGFYDQILPSEIGKYVKKWGAKVEQSTVPTSAPASPHRAAELAREGTWSTNEAVQTPIWRVAITPAMREGIETKGQPLFAANPLQDVTTGLDEAEEAPIGKTSRESEARALAPEQRKLVGSQMERAQRMAAGFTNIAGMEPADVRQEAVAALVRAATVFDPTRGVPFENFASVVVKNHLADVWRRSLGIRNEESFEENAGNGEMGRGENTAAPIERAETRAVLDEVVGELTPRLQAIVNGRMAGRSLEAIGAEINAVPSTVARGSQVALDLMRKNLNRRGITGVDADGVLSSADPLRLQPTWDEMITEGIPKVSTSTTAPEAQPTEARERTPRPQQRQETLDDLITQAIPKAPPMFERPNPFPFDSLPPDAAKSAAEDIVRTGERMEETANAPAPEPEGQVRTGSLLRELYTNWVRGRYDRLDYYAPGTAQVLQDSERDAAMVAAAMGRWKDGLERAMTKAFGYPSWWRTPLMRARLRRFRNEMLPTAAYLNATAVDSDGNFAFEDFWQRAGELSLPDAQKRGVTTGSTYIGGDGHGWRVGKRLFSYRGEIIDDTRAETLLKDPATADKVDTAYQLERFIPASEQRAVQEWFHNRYPEAAHFLDDFIAPNAAGDRVVSPQGIELPTFNRHSLFDYYGDTPMGQVGKIPGYTPDVVRSRGLAGFAANLLKLDWQSPGRDYKTGAARAGGLTRDLVEGFSIRAAQAHMESARRSSAEALLKYSMTEIPPEGVPEGYVALDRNVLNPLIRTFNEWNAREGGGTVTMTPIVADTTSQLTEANLATLRMLFGTPEAFSPNQMIRREVLAELKRDFVNTQVNNRFLQGVVSWVRGSVAGVLADFQTIATNKLSNYVFHTLRAFQRTAAAGYNLAAGEPVEARRAIREAGYLMTGFFTNFYHRDVRERINRMVPPEIFDDSNALKIAMGEAGGKTVGELLGELNVGAAALRAVGYGEMDVRAKQKLALASLLARGSIAADEAGITGAERKAWIQKWVEAATVEARREAEYAAKLYLMDYGNVPFWLDEKTPVQVAGINLTPWANLGRSLVLPFWKYPYNYARQMKRVGVDSVRQVMAKDTPKPERIEAAANLTAYAMLATLGWLLLKPWDPEDQGDIYGRDFDDAGNEMDPKLATGSRVRAADSSAFGMAINTAARMFGADTEGQENWVRVRTLPYGTQALFLGGMADYLTKKAQGKDAAAVNVADGAWNMLEDFMSVGTGARMGLSFLGYRDSYQRGQTLPFILGQGAADLLTARVLPPRAVRDIASLIDPTQRRTRPAPKLDYGAGFLDAIAERLPVINTLLPPSGKVQTGANPDSEKTMEARASLAAMGMESTAYREYVDKDGTVRAAYVRPEYIWRKPAWAIGLRQLGFNVKPVDAAQYASEAAGGEN